MGGQRKLPQWDVGQSPGRLILVHVQPHRRHSVRMSMDIFCAFSFSLFLCKKCKNLDKCGMAGMYRFEV